MTLKIERKKLWGLPDRSKSSKPTLDFQPEQNFRCSPDSMIDFYEATLSSPPISKKQKEKKKNGKKKKT